VLSLEDLLNIPNSKLKIQNSKFSSTNVLGYVFTADIGQVSKGAKAQAHQLVVHRVEFAQGRNVEGTAQKGDIALKGAAARNQTADPVGKAVIRHLDLVHPAAQGSKWT
jgi:hypothetical protein